MSKTKKLLSSMILMLGGMLSFSSFSAEFTSYPTITDEDGNYSLSWNTNLTGSWELVSFEVKEYVDNVFTENVATSGTIRSFSGKESAAYRYELSVRKRIYISRDQSYVYNTSVEDSVSFNVDIAIDTPILSISPANVTYDGDYSVSWNAVSGASTYKLEEKINGSSTWTVSQNNSQTSKNFINIPKGNYAYRITACNGGTCSLTSVESDIDVAFIPDFTHSTSTHNTIVGDFNGNGAQDAYYQPINAGVKGGVLPQDLIDEADANLHRSWTTTHPDFTAIEDWSAASYGAYSGNFDSSIGDELLLLGHKEIVLLHGDIITPIVIFPPVHNAIVSWNNSNTASYTKFEFDANPDDYEVHIGNLDTDAYDEIFLQAKSKGSQSYILNNDGSLIQTINNGYLNLEWSATSYTAEITSGRIKLTAISSNDYDNFAETNSSGSVTHLETPVTTPSVFGESPRYVYTDNEYSFTPDYESDHSVTFGISGKPSWATFNSADGTITGTPLATDIGSIHNVKITIYESKTHTIDDSLSFTLEAVESFQIPDTGYTVYQSADGTLYMVSNNGVDIFKLADDNGGLAIIKITQAEFDAANATLSVDYEVNLVDQDFDGVLDVLLQPINGSEESRILITNIASNYHTVFIGSFVEPAPEVHVEPIPDVDIASQQVGVIAANFRVDEGGAATYSIPLSLPEGTSGVKPGLAFVYSSSGSNGLIGKGWSLSGLSGITRCKTTQEHDGNDAIMRGVEFTSDDKFCLDGMRLMAVGNGVYGANGTEYATEINTIQRIISYGAAGNGPAYFTVEAKDGSIRYYGNTSDSQLLVNKDLTATDTVAMWSLNRSEDSVGNYIEFTYETDQDVGIHRISEIAYTGNSTINPYNHIYFDYETRDDSREFYVEGSKNLIDKRLSSVRVLTPDPVTDVSTLVKRYELDYEASTTTNESLLNSVTECSGSADNTCLLPTTFAWEHGIQGFESTPAYSQTIVSPEILAMDPVDFNGDGLTDLALLTKKGEGYDLWSSLISENGLEFKGYHWDMPNGGLDYIVSHAGDIDGDGNMDYLAPKYNVSGSNYTYYVYKGKVDDGLVPWFDTGVLYDTTKDQKEITLGDINGDGLADIIIQKSNSQLGIRLNTGGDFAAEVNYTLTVNDNAGPFFKRWVDGIRSVQDNDGDGNMDILFVGKNCSPNPEFPSSCRGGIATGSIIGQNKVDASGNTYFYVQTSDYWDKTSPRSYSDINGDNVIDMTFENSIYINKGDNTHLYTYKPDLIENVDKSHTVDYNGDGLMDIMYPKDLSGFRFWYVRLSNGTDYDSPLYTGLRAPSENDKTIELFGDFNGDGRLDYLEVKDGYEVKLTYGKASNTSNNVITRFTNGFGEYQEVKYKLLTDNSVYTKGSGANQLNYGNNSPVFDIIAPMFVVSEAVGNSPNYEDDNATLSVSYEYEAGRAQAGGRGFLGFEKLYSTDLDTGIVTMTEYHQNFPYAGKAKRTIVGYSKTQIEDYLAAGLPLPISEVVNTWATKTVTLNGTNFPYISNTTSTQNFGGVPHTKVVEQTLDDYQNITRIEENLYQIQSGQQIHIKKVITDNKYEQDNYSLWHIGRLTESSVTTSRPNEDQTEVPPITRVSEFNYDNSTGLINREVINPNGSVNKKLTIAYGYDSFGNTIRKTRCSGHIAENDCGTSDAIDLNNPYHINRYTRTEWDSRGRFEERLFNSLEQKTSEVISRHITGAPTQTRNLDGVVIDKLYDAHGRLQFERSSTGSWALDVLNLREDSSGNVIGFTKNVSGGGMPSSFEDYDILARLERKYSVSYNDATQFIYSDTTYDSRGRVYFESSPYISSSPQVTSVGTTYTYDVFDRVTSTLHPSGLTSSVEFGDGLSKIITNQIGQSRTEELNALGELIGVYDDGDNSKTTHYIYDALGNLRITRNVDGIDTDTITYDELGRKSLLVGRDVGSWTYHYNVLDELIEQTDANNHTTNNYYDRLGRKTHRVENGAQVVDTFWYYDSYDGKSYPGKLIHEVETLSGFAKTYEYDSLGRQSSVTTHVPASGIHGQSGYVAEQDYVESATYDEFGRVFQQFDASGNEAGIRFVYNDRGYLERVRDTRHNESTFYYKIKDMDAFGNITNIETGNGIESIRDYDDQTGLLKKITTGSSGEIQTLEYNFNAIGRLEWRESYTPEGGYIREDFGYDALNRLETATVNNSQIAPLVIEYFDNGNIKNKSDVSASNYSYTSDSDYACSNDANTLHAVKQIGTTDYCYDNNGNQTARFEAGVETRRVVYNLFNKPTEIYNATNGHTTSFQYGPDRGRYVRVDDSGSETNTTHYVGGLEVHYKDNGQVEYKRSIGGRAIVKVSGSTTETSYLHKDYQGSITAITGGNSNPSVTQRLSFDPFGKRRAEITWETLDDNLLLNFDHDITTRGYTGHEMLDEVGIIHMNGRTYDSNIGRFMQADIAVQDPGNGQNLNRFSYVLNSPMSYTDPSGYFYYRVPPKKPESNPFGMVLSIAAAVFTQGYSIYVQMAVQAVVGYATTGNFGGAAIGAFTAGAWYATGTALKAIGAGPWTQALVRGSIGGMTRVMQGGKFGHGFISAAGASLAGPMIEQFDSGATQIFASAIVGGTLSELTGGKFGNGAVTAALMWAFNHRNHLGGSNSNNTSSTSPNITGSDKVAFVGGAMDKTQAKVVLGKYKAYIKANGADSAEYFEWTDTKALSTYVADNNGRVTVVAHSYGADEAAHLIADGMQVYKFVSVDPVGWTRPNMQLIANNSVIWNNYESTASMWNSWGDFVAAIGGSWGSLPSSHATHNASSQDHVTICSTYCNP